MLFEGKLSKGKEIPLADALIEAGADLDFQRDRDDGKRSETPLIGAASLGAEDLGLDFCTPERDRSFADYSAKQRFTGRPCSVRIGWWRG
jgi:hypothetical protein